MSGEVDRARGLELLCGHCGCTRWYCLDKFGGACCDLCEHPATPTEEPHEHDARTGTCPECGHQWSPNGCTGDPTPSDLWAGVSPRVCDCPCPISPGTTPAEVAVEEREACCEHSLSWHHEQRGCGYHGFAPGHRCPCLLTFDEALSHHDAALLDDLRTRAHTAADEFAAEFGHAHPWVAKIRALGEA